MTDLSFVPGVALLVGGGFVGFFTCAVMTAGKVAENDADWHDMAADYTDRAFEATKAHSRCSDALNVCQSKLSDVRDLLSQPETIRKGQLRAIVGGDA